MREPYALAGHRAEVHAGGALDIIVGVTNVKGVVPWDGPGSPSVAGHNARGPSRALGIVVRARLGAEGVERWWFER